MPEIERRLRTVLAGAAVSPTAQDLERALVPVYVFDPASLAILAANAAAQRLYGYSGEEFRRMSILDIRPPEEAARTRRYAAEDKPDGLWFSGVWRHRARDGRVFDVSAMGSKTNWKGRPAILVIVTDLTQTMRLPDSAAGSGNVLFPFVEQIDEVACVRSLDDRRLVYINRAFERVFGLTRETAYADPDAVPRMVVPEDANAYQQFRQAQGKEALAVEYRIRRPDGALRWIASRCFPMQDAAGHRMMVGLTADITERKLAEQRRIEAVEAQRDALVREVHHRIKNSLQGVHGLLRRFAAAHPALAPLLAEAAGQVQSVAVVHGLQGRTAAGRVELCDLVRHVAGNAASLMQARLAVDIPPNCDPCLAIGEKDAVPLALVINELAFNAIKHTVGEGPQRLALALELPQGRAELRVSNPGRLPAGFDPAGHGGGGLELMHLLLPPHGARLVWQQEGGEVVATLSLDAPAISVVGAATSKK